MVISKDCAQCRASVTLKTNTSTKYLYESPEEQGNGLGKVEGWC